MSPITTHVLDTSRGRPATGIDARLYVRRNDAWEIIGRGVTDADGRIRDWLEPGAAVPGVYRITFETAAYFAAMGVRAFYPTVTVDFEVTAGERHYHVPLLLSPFGYSTYRGS
jgi:5-hydroxyisourate hydrolase